jgi:CHAT domain-containing protein
MFSRKQSEQLQEKFAGEYFFDNAATLTAFEKSSSGHSIVQVATHSVSSDSIDKESELLFSNGSMRLSDLYGMKMQAELCIISACQTGDGRQEYGDGTRSFSRAFAYSGAKGTISTLWCVDDKAPAQVLEHFYNQLENGDMTPVSLKKAKLLYAATCSSSELANPFYWAGIVYSGYPDQKIQLDRHYPFMKYLALALASALLIGLLIKKMKRGI